MVVSSNATGTFLSANEKVDWMTSVAAHFGYAANNGLFYGRAGLAYPSASPRPKVGWLLGAGIERGFTPN